MKNCIEFCALSSKFPGSFIKCMYKLLEHAKAQGIKIDFVFPKEAKETEWCKIISQETNVFFVTANKGTINIKTYYEIYKILKCKNYDIIHSHYETFDINLYLLKSILKLKSNLIWHLHCFPLETLDKLSILRKFYYTVKYRFFTKKVNFITINDKNNKTLSKYAKKANSICTIFNGINTDDLQEKTLTFHIPTFITLGWDFYTKGDDLILEASKLLVKKNYKFKILINGNENTFNEILKYFDNNLPDYFEFQYPVVSRNDFFDKGNIFIQASRNETFSYGVCEASYLGKNVICSNIPGMKWAFSLPNVKTFESESVEDLASVMEKMILNKSFSDFDKEYVKNQIMFKYSDDVWVNNILNYYSSII